MSTLTEASEKSKMQRKLDKAAEITPEERLRGEAFAAWLKAARERAGWSKRMLHLKAGVSESYIGVLENNGISNTTGAYQRPSVDFIARIAAATCADEDAGRAAAGWSPRVEMDPGKQPRIVLRPGASFRVLDYTGEGEVLITDGLAALLREMMKPIGE